MDFIYLLVFLFLLTVIFSFASIPYLMRKNQKDLFSIFFILLNLIFFLTTLIFFLLDGPVFEKHFDFINLQIRVYEILCLLTQR